MLREYDVSEKSRMAVPCLWEMWNVGERCEEKKSAGQDIP